MDDVKKSMKNLRDKMDGINPSVSKDTEEPNKKIEREKKKLNMSLAQLQTEMAQLKKLGGDKAKGMDEIDEGYSCLMDSSCSVQERVEESESKMKQLMERSLRELQAPLI